MKKHVLSGIIIGIGAQLLAGNAIAIQPSTSTSYATVINQLAANNNTARQKFDDAHRDYTIYRQKLDDYNNSVLMQNLRARYPVNLDNYLVLPRDIGSIYVGTFTNLDNNETLQIYLKQNQKANDFYQRYISHQKLMRSKNEKLWPKRGRLEYLLNREATFDLLSLKVNTYESPELLDYLGRALSVEDYVVFVNVYFDLERDALSAKDLTLGDVLISSYAKMR